MKNDHLLVVAWWVILNSPDLLATFFLQFHSKVDDFEPSLTMLPALDEVHIALGIPLPYEALVTVDVFSMGEGVEQTILFPLSNTLIDSIW